MGSGWNLNLVVEPSCRTACDIWKLMDLCFDTLLFGWPKGISSPGPIGVWAVKHGGPLCHLKLQQHGLADCFIEYACS